MRLRALLGAVTLLCVTGVLPAHATVNGKSAEGNDFVVPLSIIFRDSNLGYVCTGTLLSATVVVTAAHCVQGRDGKIASIRVGPAGSQNLPGATWTSVVGTFLPSSYFLSATDVQPDDIAFLQLAHPVPFFNDIHLATENELKSAEGSADQSSFKAHAYGYGPVDLAAWNIFPGEIDGFIEPVVASSNVDQRFNNVRSFNGIRSGVCGGDSGGPVTYEENGSIFLIGVIAGSAKDGNCAANRSSRSQQLKASALTVLAAPFADLYQAAVAKSAAPTSARTLRLNPPARL